MSQTYFAILTAVGEAKLANATALGTQVQISRMAVGDGNGNLPVPNRLQTALVRETYRADLNELKADPANASQIIAELVIPETEGGYWLREMGLYDEAGDLLAVANCPPSYKPQMSEGSGRTQVLRIVLIVSSTAAVQLKIDPSVVLATREFVTTTVAAELAKQDAKISVKVATTVNLQALSGLLTVDGVTLAAGDRVLVKNQAAGATNGIYVAATEAWPRAADADANLEVTPGMFVPVEQGTINADSVWQLVTDAPITVGTTALVFEMAAGSTGVTAGSYSRVTVNKRGLVTGGANPTTIAGYGISDALHLSAAAILAPPGQVAVFAMTEAPNGWLKANGTILNRATYAALFAAIGTTFGAGDGSTTFRLPDLRGEFIRGWDDGRGLDADRALGSVQTDEIKSHTHPLITYRQSSFDSTGGHGFGGLDVGGGTLDADNITKARGGTETRPRNIALLACIKF